jgi:hypothetical protein
MPEENRGASRIWEIAIALIPVAAAIGYANAFLHEMAFCNEFGIPLKFIVIDNTTILLSFSYIFLLVLLMFWFISSLFTLKAQDNKWNPVYSRVILAVAVLIAYVLFGVIYPPTFSLWPYILGFIALLIIYVFVRPNIKIKDKEKSYLDKLKAQDDADAIRPTSMGWLIRYVGRGGFLILVVIFYMLWASYFSGSGEAKTQVRYYVPSTHPEAVVLRIYGDNLICATLDRAANQIEREYFVIKANNEPVPHLKYDYVGQLTVKPLPVKQ